MANFIEIAIDQAKKAALLDEVPVGAVIVWNNEVIATTHNRTEEYYDPTAHAEMLAIQAACEKLGAPRIPECDLYVTLEPCPMCVAAISAARIRNVYFGAYDAKTGGVKLATDAAFHHKPQYYGGMAETECSNLLKEFFAAKR